ncbi:MAG: exodeoxyribonuclease VII large subunit [Geobacter sp.]|nr:exodeoxyribonuclease VII large subunit [Geobacter sp.]
MELFAEKRILTVSQLSALVKDVLEENFEQVWVEGEVSNLATPQSGHIYLTLKDAGAQLKCVLFRAAARSLRFKIRDGMRLIVRGRISVFAQRGDYQLIAEYLEPQGIGALQLAFLQLKERLAREGLFAEANKKPIPRLPRRIGVVTSPTGAAIHDILTMLDRRFANIEVLLIPVKVQGEGAAVEIASAIRDFNLYRDVDVLIVGRGGGSLEDLWAFNEEIVARAIASSRIPVISAVGHEIDFTIADLAADLRAPTPSAAAELVITSKAELTTLVQTLEHRLGRAAAGLIAGLKSRVGMAQASLRDPAMLIGQLGQRVDFMQERMSSLLGRMLARHTDRLSALIEMLRLRSPGRAVEHGREQLQNLVARRDQAVQRRMDHLRETMARRTGALDALSPLATLARGYSLAQREKDGLIVRSSDQLAVGDRLRLRLHRGSAGCLVETVEPAVADQGSA